RIADLPTRVDLAERPIRLPPVRRTKPQDAEDLDAGRVGVGPRLLEPAQAPAEGLAGVGRRGIDPGRLATLRPARAGRAVPAPAPAVARGPVGGGAVLPPPEGAGVPLAGAGGVAAVAGEEAVAPPRLAALDVVRPAADGAGIGPRETQQMPGAVADG